jgi:LacI family transcriptional regulator
MTNTTLKLLAQQLQLSISTVSRALKDHPDISAATKEKVNALAQSLDYEPNAYAIQLRTQSSKILGVIVPAISNLFYDSFISAVEEESRKNGYALMILQSSNNAENELNNLKIFRQNRVSGVFACLSANTENLEVYHKMNEREIPVVFFDIVPKDNRFTKVRMADERCAVIAAEKIIQRNAKRVLAIFGDEALSISQKRKSAFQNFMQSYAPKTHCTYIHAKSSKEAEELFLKQANKVQKADTVFCMTDEVLIGVMKAVQALEIKVPNELGIITISNGFIPNLYHPNISYVETSGFELGKLAFVQMMANMKGGKTLTELTVEAKFVDGGSM